MASVTVEVTGPVPVQTVWQRYLHPERWTEWAPHVTGVSASTGILRPGTTGTVIALKVVPARFTVRSVDPATLAWSWTVRVGPVRLDLHHDLAAEETHGQGGTRARIRMEGPLPMVVAYRPLMRWAMHRLVT